MKLIFVRHGETHHNKKRVIQGQLNSKLSPEGIAQAKLLAKRLKNEEIDAVFCSDLLRARQTAKEIRKYHKKVPIEYDKLLRERAFGNFENKHWDEWLELQQKSGIPRHIYKTKGGENFHDLQKRVRRFLSKIYPKYKNKTVLIVSHGGVNRVMLTIFMKRPLKNILDLEQKNTSVNIVKIPAKGKAKIRIINCTKHLE